MSEPILNKVLVLGSKGFIGTRLSAYLERTHPDIEVIGIDLREHDLARPAAVAGLSKHCTPGTAIVLLAATKRQFGDTQEIFKDNLDIVMNICDLIRNHPVDRIAFFSSAAVYGEDIDHSMITEQTTVHPTSYYGMGKFVSERLIWKEVSNHGNTSCIFFRPPTIYGPGDRGGTYGPVKFLQSHITGQELTLWGDGSELREFVYIDDVVEVVSRLLLSQQDGVFNVASGSSYTFQDSLRLAQTLSGKTIKIDSRERTKDKVDNAFDNAKLLDAIGPYTFTTLADGMASLYQDLVAKSA